MSTTGTLTAEELNYLCEQNGGLSRFRSAMEGLLAAVKAKGYTAAVTMEDVIAACKSMDFSIDSAIRQSALTETGKTEFAAILLDKIQHTLDFWAAGTEITASVAAYDTDLLFIPAGMTVKAGSCASAFLYCSSLMWVGDGIDWSPATSLDSCFNYAGMLENDELTFDISNATTAKSFAPKVETIHLVGMGARQKTYATQGQTSMLVGSNKIKTITGLNMSWNTELNSGSHLISTATENIEMEGFIRTMTHLVTHNNKMKSFASLTGASLWQLCKHSYDFNHTEVNDDGYGKNVVLSPDSYTTTWGFTEAQLTKLEEYFATLSDEERTDADGNVCDNISDYLTAKGWSV